MIASEEQATIVSRAIRFGPNPALTIMVIAGAGSEALAFNTLETRFPELQVLLVSSLFWMWLSLAWIVWYGSAIISFARLSRFGKVFLAGAACAVAYFSIIAYALCWITFSNTGVFPDAGWLELIGAGARVIYFEVQRSSSEALTIFLAFALTILFLFPFLPRLLLRNQWEAGRRSHSFQVAVWAVAGFVAVLAFWDVLTEPDKELRRKNLHIYSTATNPAFAVISSIVQTESKVVKPVLETAELEPVVPQTSSPKLAQKPFSVIYVLVESLRSDVIDKVHQGKEITPHINALARKSIVFTNAYAQATHTDYALPSFLSGQFPLRSLKHYYYKQVEPWPKTLIYNHLKDQGYKTAIISADTTNWSNVRDFLRSDKLDAYFDAENLPTTYSKLVGNGYISNPETVTRSKGKAVSDKVAVDFQISWIDDHIDDVAPYFLHAFFYAPHFPYELHPGDKQPFQPSELNFSHSFFGYPKEKLETVKNAYYNAVHATDAQIGRLLEHLKRQGELDNTVVVISGDHGEAFLEHDKVTHSGPLYQEEVRVPCIMYAPNIIPRSEDYPIQHVDMPATLCGLLGLPPHPGFQGIDVLNSKRPPIEEREIYIHSEVPAIWQGEVIVYGNRWKYWNDRHLRVNRLFDLKTDPEELQDVASVNPGIASMLHQKLMKWRERQLSYYTFSNYYTSYYPPDP